MASVRGQKLSIRRLQRGDAHAVVDVLSESFFGYPVMRFVLGEAGNYNERLPQLVELFVATRVQRNDPMFGAHDGTRLVAAVTTSNPADPAAPDFAALRAQAWQRLGADAQERYEQCVAAWGSLVLDRPQLHVNMIGVRADYRGRGLAAQLLDEVHTLCEESALAEGVSLTTEEPRNVELYRHLGYQVVGETNITDGLTTRGFFRPC